MILKQWCQTEFWEYMRKLLLLLSCLMVFIQLAQLFFEYDDMQIQLHVLLIGAIFGIPSLLALIFPVIPALVYDGFKLSMQKKKVWTFMSMLSVMKCYTRNFKIIFVVGSCLFGILLIHFIGPKSMRLQQVYLHTHVHEIKLKIPKYEFHTLFNQIKIFRDKNLHYLFVDKDIITAENILKRGNKYRLNDMILYHPNSKNMMITEAKYAHIRVPQNKYFSGLNEHTTLALFKTHTPYARLERYWRLSIQWATFMMCLFAVMNSDFVETRKPPYSHAPFYIFVYCFYLLLLLICRNQHRYDSNVHISNFLWPHILMAFFLVIYLKWKKHAVG